MDFEIISLEIFYKETLNTSIIFSVKHFPVITKNAKSESRLQKTFEITEKFLANFLLFPLGLDGTGKNISMVLSVKSPLEYEFSGTVNFAVLAKHGEKDLISKGSWSVLEGPRIEDLLDAKYLTGGTLRVQVDLTLNYRFIDDEQIRSARNYLRGALQCPFFGDVVFKVQNHFMFNLHWEMLCKYYQRIKSLSSVGSDQDNKPIYALPRTDPYYFENMVVDCYMNEAKYGRAMRG